METQVPARRLLIVPFGFALIGVLLLTLIWTSFGGIVPLSPRGYRVTADFPQASNLYGGADVRIAGINVGQVQAVARAGNQAQVTMQLQPSYVPLHTGTRAILRTKTLLGEAYIELAPGPQRSRTIPDGGRLAPGQVLAAQQLSDVLSTYNPQTRRQLQSLLAGLASAARGQASALNNDSGWSAPAIANLSTVLDVVDGQRAQLTQLLGSAGQLLTAVGQRQGALQAAITSGDQVLAVTASRTTALRATLRDLPNFLAALRSTTATASRAVDPLNAAVTALTPVAPAVAPALSSGAALSAQLRALFRATPRLIAAGERGLPAGTAILKAAGPTITRLFPVAQQLVPVIQFAQVMRNSIVAAFANDASLAEGYQPSPSGTQDHYLAATELIWNEMLGGYQKRLPSNRQNPYFAPNGQLDIAHGGLKAYDCRNVNNPNTVPSSLFFGGAAPPCVTQGPWSFDGVPAYFPRLRPAAP